MALFLYPMYAHMIMNRKVPFVVFLLFAMASFSGCDMLHQSAKYSFTDGVYRTKKFSHDSRVYVLKVDDDTLTVFPVREFKDSTAIMTKQRVDYTSRQKKFKDNKVLHVFYKPSFDLDVMTIPINYRPPVFGYPNQLTNNFNGALYGGYRIDAYKLSYRRTPLNTYKQKIKHVGYSAGLFLGMGNAYIDAFSLRNPNYPYQYEGALLLTGVAANIAAGHFTIGIALGTDHLLDKNHSEWIYEGQPCIGFTVGLNLN